MDKEIVNELRHKISTIACETRVSRIETYSPKLPIFVKNYDIFLDGIKYRRKKIILAAPGCTSATCNMCPIPNEGFRGTKQVTHEDYIDQFESAFKNESVNEFQIISLYNSGNWFNNKEVPAKTRAWIYQLINTSSCQGVAVESLPQFITPEKIKEAKENLGQKQLIVGIGLQSADDFIRAVCVNTACTKPQFERASKLLRKNGYIPRAYLMIKPPFLTEDEAISETVQSIEYVKTQGYRDVSICPTRVVPNTVVAELNKLKLYKPPSLWSVIEILRRVSTLDISTRVSCLDIDGKDEDTIYPRNCGECTPIILSLLNKYNLGELDISGVGNFFCFCQDTFDKSRQEENSTIGTVPLERRVSEFIGIYHQRTHSNI